MDDEMKAKIQEHEKRLAKVEDVVFGKQMAKVPPAKKGYNGLAGGIRMLIDNEFLNEPKSVDEVFKELKREMYHYSKIAVDKLLRVNFTKDQRKLTRVKEEGKWRYVIRK